MANCITKIRTADGDMQYDYNSLANKPDETLLKTSSKDLIEAINEINSKAGTSSLELSTDLETSGKAADSKIAGDFTRQAFHAGIVSNSKALNTPFMENVLKFINGEVVDEQFVHLSDKVPTMSDLENGYVIVFGEPVGEEIGSGFNGECMEIFPKSVNEEVFNSHTIDAGNGCIIVGDGVIIVPEDNYDFDGLVFPKKGVWGVYFITTFLINRYDFNGGGDYFIEVDGRIEVGSTLTWDGNTAGLEYTGNDQFAFYKISNTVIKAEDITGDAIITMINIDGTETTETISIDNISTETEGAVAFGEYVISITKEYAAKHNYPSEGTYFLKVELGHTTGITVPGVTFTKGGKATKLDNKCLQILIEQKATTISNTLTWDGDISGIETDFQDFLYKVNDTFISADDLSNLGSYTLTYSDGSMKVINFTDKDFVIEDGHFVGINNSEFNSVVILFASEKIGEAFEGLSAGVYFVNSMPLEEAKIHAYVSSLTVNGVQFEVVSDETGYKIDNKYLDILTGQGEPIIASTLTWDGNTSGLVKAIVTDTLEESHMCLICEDTNWVADVDISDITIKVSSDDSEEIASGKLLSDDTCILVFNSQSLDGYWVVIALKDNVSNGELGFTFPKKGIYCPMVTMLESDFSPSGYVGDGYLEYLKVNGHTFTLSEGAKIKEQYIPDTIATKEYVDSLLLTIKALEARIAALEGAA